MAEQQSIESRIDSLFEEEPIPDDIADKLFDIFLKNLETAEKRLYGRFTVVMVLWVVAIGISNDFFSAMSFLSVRVTDLSIVLSVIPVAMAVYAYGMVTNLHAVVSNLAALEMLIKNRWRKIYDADVSNLIMSPSFLMTEVRNVHQFVGKWKTISDSWNTFLLFSFFALPLSSLIHVSTINLTDPPLFLWLNILLLTLALLFVIRIVLLMLQIWVEISNPTLQGNTLGQNSKASS